MLTLFDTYAQMFTLEYYLTKFDCFHSSSTTQSESEQWIMYGWVKVNKTLLTVKQ